MTPRRPGGSQARGWSLIAALVLAGSAQGAFARPGPELEAVVPMADSVDAGLFAPKPYLEALRALYGDTFGAAPGGEQAVEREAAQLFRRAEAIARGEGAAVVSNARRRFDAVRQLAVSARADRDGGDAYSAANALAARAEGIASNVPASRALWDEAIDSLVAAMDAAERVHVAALREAPKTPYTAYNACPFEGCCFRIWFAQRDLVARVEPDSASAKAFELRAGDGVLGITGILITRKLGHCMLDLRPDEVRDGRQPEPVILLGYEGEGFYRAYDRGRLAFVECDGDQEVVEPQCDWWAMVQNRDGIVGWVVGRLREEAFFYNQDAIVFAPFYGAQDCR